MYLTREEERILSGEEGEFPSKALRVIVKVGEVLGADRLVPISHAHISGVSYLNIGDAGLEFIEEVANEGLRAKVFTTANPYAVTDIEFKEHHLPKEFIAKQERVVKALIKIGAKAFTCAPYYVRRPRKGEHLAWAESNAVLYANSVCGARTNREGGPLTLLASLVGRTYFGGLHIDELRKPKKLIIVDKELKGADINDELLYGVLGYLIGEESGSDIPYVKGVPQNISELSLRELLAGAGTSSNLGLVIIEGISPEARLYSDQYLHKLERVSIGLNDIKKFIKEHECTETPDLYIAGCPHLSYDDLMGFLKYLSNSELPKNVDVWLITSDIVRNELVSKGFIEKFRRRGVKVITNVCPVVSPLAMLGVKRVATNSAKALYYLSRLARVKEVCLMRFNEFIKRLVTHGN